MFDWVVNVSGYEVGYYYAPSQVSVSEFIKELYYLIYFSKSYISVFSKPSKTQENNEKRYDYEN